MFNCRSKLRKSKINGGMLYRFYQGDRDDFDELMQSELKQHPYILRSFSWVFSLPLGLPELHFDRWHFFNAIVKKSIVSKTVL